MDQYSLVIFLLGLKFAPILMLRLALALGCMVVVRYILDPKPHRDHKLPLTDKLRKLDPLSFFILLTSLTCLFLGLEWGEFSVSWSNPKAWGCILGFGLLALAFTCLQGYRGDE